MKTIFGIKGFDVREYGISANAMLGIRDSGKTYDAMKAAEELFDADIPFAAFDPIGVWHNIRIPGKGKGYPVVVAGGRHGDLPLTTKNCGAIVRAAMESRISLVIDLFSMELSKADWRRIVRECTEILLHENHDHGLRHIFIEEAGEFVPQRVQDGQVFAAVEKLVRMGGNSKLGATLINQRSADLNKSVLELCANVFVHRQKGKNTILDLKKWFEVLELTDGERAKIEHSLPNLKSGECWALLHDLPKPVFLKVPEKNSLHPDRRSTASKEDVAKRKPVPADAFVEAMKAKLAPKPAPAKAAPAPAVPAKGGDYPLKMVENIAAANRQQGREEGLAIGWAAGDRNGWERGMRESARAWGIAAKALTIPATEYVPETMPSRVGKMMSVTVHGPRPGFVKSAMEEVAKAAAPMMRAAVQQAVEGALPGPIQKIIDAIATWSAMGTKAPRRVQVAFIAGYSPKSSSFEQYVSRARTSGLIVGGSGTLELTLAGVTAATPVRFDDSDQLRAQVLSMLGGPEQKVLRSAMEAYPNEIDRETLASETGYSPTSSSFEQYVSRVRSLDLIQRHGAGTLRAVDWLFPEGK